MSMTALFIYTLKSMVSIVILGSIMIGAYEGCEAIGIPLGASVLDFEKAIEELLKGLPHIGSIVGLVFDVKGAVGGTDSVQISLLMEVVYGILIFIAFKLMHGIKKMVDQVFCSMLTYSGFFYAVSEYFEMMFLVFLSVMLSRVLKQAVTVLFTWIGIEAGTGLVVAVLVIGVFISICIGKRLSVIETVVNTAFDLISGFAIVSLIYMVVLCTQILSMYSGMMAWNDLIFVFSGEIIGLLALTMIGAGTFAKAIANILKV